MRYRRSRTTKAPRKRTFLLTMQKPSVQGLAEASTARGTCIAAAVAGKDMFTLCCGGNDNNNAGCGGNNKNGGNNNNNNNNRDCGGWGGDGADGQREGRFPAAALLGAVVLSFGIIAPLPSMAAPVDLIERFSPAASCAGNAAAMGASLPKAVALRSATLVIPNAGNAFLLARKSAPNSIVYGQVYITDDEKRHADNTQFNAREALRVY